MDAVDVLMGYSVLVPRVKALEADMASITNPMLVKGTVDTVADLENVQNPQPGWVYLVGLEEDPNKKEYVYTDEDTWDFLGYQQPIDAAMSTTSENAVQNKVVTVAINGKAALTIIAAAFDSTVTYSAGKIVIKDGSLFIYSSQQASSGDWDASKWIAITIGSQLEAKANSADLATVATSGSYNDLSNKPTIPSITGLAKETALADEYDEQTTYAEGDYYVLNGELYKIVSGTATKITVSDELDLKANASAIPDAVTQNSNGDIYIGNTLIIKYLTQAEYDLLDPPDPHVQYNIIETTPSQLSMSNPSASLNLSQQSGLNLQSLEPLIEPQGLTGNDPTDEEGEDK